MANMAAVVEFYKGTSISELEKMKTRSGWVHHYEINQETGEWQKRWAILDVGKQFVVLCLCERNTGQGKPSAVLPLTDFTTEELETAEFQGVAHSDISFISGLRIMAVLIVPCTAAKCARLWEARGSNATASWQGRPTSAWKSRTGHRFRRPATCSASTTPTSLAPGPRRCR